MAEPGRKASRPAIIEALVLAASRTQLREIVGPDALRTVLNAHYTDFVKDGAFDLQGLWDILEEQPGFQPERAYGALCRFWAWDKDLGISIRLPRQMEALSSLERDKLAALVPVKRAELDALLGREPARPAGKQVQRARVITSEMAPVAAAAPETGWRKHAPRVLGAVAAVALLFTAFQVYSFLRGPAYETISVADLAGTLPARTAERLGKQVRVTLADEAWFDAPESERREQLAKALTRLVPLDVDGILVVDGERRVRASAELAGSPARPVIRFR